jgi:regulation of enolase protein 1 (concanavalin A-like superfamily)
MVRGSRWLNEPPEWSRDETGLNVVTGKDTDFWQETYYGFRRDDGHFYHEEVEGDFTADATFEGAYETLYDQAGLMLRLDETHWIKAGIELSDGALQFSVVVTNGRSDWSVREAPAGLVAVSVRLTRHDDAVRVQFADASGAWHMARLASLPQRSPSFVGIMCCSPQRAGFRVRFTSFTIGPPIGRALHAPE